jgi:hypothetical protein
MGNVLIQLCSAGPITWRAKTKAEVENEDARKMLRQEARLCTHKGKGRTEDDNDIPGTTEKTKYMREAFVLHI